LAVIGAFISLFSVLGLLVIYLPTQPQVSKERYRSEAMKLDEERRAKLQSVNRETNQDG
jgi:hypothetical protein